MPISHKRQEYINKYNKGHYKQEWAYGVKSYGKYESLINEPVHLDAFSTLTLVKSFAVYEDKEGRRFVLNKDNIVRRRTLKSI
jgi:hypothetical protein